MYRGIKLLSGVDGNPVYSFVVVQHERSTLRERHARSEMLVVCLLACLTHGMPPVRAV